jgi:hypothetical protein
MPIRCETSRRVSDITKIRISLRDCDLEGHFSLHTFVGPFPVIPHIGKPQRANDAVFLRVEAKFAHGPSLGRAESRFITRNKQIDR